MTSHWSIAGVMLVSGAACAAFALFLFRRPGAVGRLGLAAVFAAAAVWGIAYGVELASTGSARDLWGSLKYVGIVALAPAWVVFALQYAGRDRAVSRRLLALLAVEPVVMLTLLALPGTRGLVRSYPAGTTTAFVHVDLGPAFYVLLSWSAILAAVGAGIIVVALAQTSPGHRRQTIVLLSAITLVFGANVLATVGVGWFREIDPTPVALALAGAVLVSEVFRFGLLDLVPVARTTLVETMPDPVLVVDAHRRVVDHNLAAQRVFGISEARLVGRRLHELIDVELPDARDGAPVRSELTLAGPDGDQSFEVVMSAIGDGRSGVGHLVVLRDITAWKDTQRRLQQLAHYDVTTGLPNRALFGERFEEALERSRVRGESVAVLFLDLDRFKLINDSFGHAGGDIVLAAVGRRLQTIAQPQDTLARLGGDEFGLLLPTIDGGREPLTVAAEALAVLAAPMLMQDTVLTISASIGIAVCPRDGVDQLSLLRQSDLAMYEAKARGGARAQLADGGQIDPRPTSVSERPSGG